MSMYFNKIALSDNGCGINIVAIDVCDVKILEITVNSIDHLDHFHEVKYTIRSKDINDFIDLLMNLEKNGLTDTDDNEKQKFSITFDDDSKKLIISIKDDDIILSSYSVDLRYLTEDNKKLLLFNFIECIRKGFKLGIEKSKDLMLKQYSYKYKGKHIDINKDLSVLIFNDNAPMELDSIIEKLIFKRKKEIIFTVDSQVLSSEADISKFINSIYLCNDIIILNHNIMINTYVNVTKKQEKHFREELKKHLLNNLCDLNHKD